jgi:hypothetical protein
VPNPVALSPRVRPGHVEPWVWPLLGALLLTSACRPPATLSEDPSAAPGTPREPGISVTTPGEWTMPYGSQTLHVYADPSLAPEVARLFSLFEDLAAERVPLNLDTRLPIGWTTLSFAVEGDRGERLVVREPDYADRPETQTRPDISVSLATLARQRLVLEHAGVAGAAIGFDQHVLTITGSLVLDEVFLLRVESPGGRMTGWRLSPTEGIAEDSQTESIPVYEVLAARPALLDAMLLPPGYMAFYEGDTLTTIVNESDEVVWDRTLTAVELERAESREPPKPLLEPLD